MSTGHFVVQQRAGGWKEFFHKSIESHSASSFEIYGYMGSGISSPYISNHVAIEKNTRNESLTEKLSPLMGFKSYTSEPIHRHDLVCANMTRCYIEYGAMYLCFYRKLCEEMERLGPFLAFHNKSLCFKKKFLRRLMEISTLEIGTESGLLVRLVSDFVLEYCVDDINLDHCKTYSIIYITHKFNGYCNIVSDDTVAYRFCYRRCLTRGNVVVEK